jgi:hypothetical protein
MDEFHNKITGKRKKEKFSLKQSKESIKKKKIQFTSKII